MKMQEAAKATNSWHWLAAASLVAAVVSVFMPVHGWRDALADFNTKQRPRIKAAAERLAALERLSEADAEAPLRQAEELKKRHAGRIALFDALGFEKLPKGEKAVFDAQSKVAEALAARRIGIVSTGAKVGGSRLSRPAETGGSRLSRPAEAGGSRLSRPAEAGGSRLSRPLTAAEFRRESEAVAAGMKDRALREMFLADVERKAAQLEAAEKKAGKVATSATLPVATSATLPVATSAPLPAVATSAPLPGFTSIDIDYAATGDFRDIFMFFVSETHKKPCYSFKDIAVSKLGDAMALAFTLQVDHK